MSASSLPWPRAKFFMADTNLPVPGGKVWTYLSGTTTPQQTLVSPSGAANTNPVILDANGEASIYLIDGISYTINVLDASNAQIEGYPVDNLVGADALLRADLASSNVSRGSKLVAYLRPLANAVATTVYNWINGQQVSVFDFMTLAQIADVQSGAYTLDVTGSCLNAISASKNLYWPAGTYKITAALTTNVTNVNWRGDGNGLTVLKASGNFAAAMAVGAASGTVHVSGMTFTTTGTTTQCVSVAVSSGGAYIHFDKCGFNGDLTGDLVYSNGQNLYFNDCTWAPNSANTWGLNFDSYNQNTTIMGGIMGGAGNGLRITNAATPGSNRVEGLKLIGLWMTCNGATSVDIGNSFYTQLIGCVLDQAGTNNLRIRSGADLVQVTGGYFGLATSGGQNVRVEVTAGGGHYLGAGLSIYGGSVGVQIEASAAAHVSNVQLDGIIFNNCAVESLLLDSVAHCFVTNCIDRSNPSSGSWCTLDTHTGNGSYVFDNNSWSTTAQASLLGGSYKFGNEQGLLGKNSGTTASGGGTSLVINHGLIGTPSKVVVTPKTNAGTFFWNTPTSTQFTITYATAGVQTFTWEASL